MLISFPPFTPQGHYVHHGNFFPTLRPAGLLRSLFQFLSHPSSRRAITFICKLYMVNGTWQNFFPIYFAISRKLRNFADKVTATQMLQGIWVWLKEVISLVSKQVMDRIEYLVLLVAEFAARSRVSEAAAYRYLSQYGALALCNKHYNVMHTLSVEENIQTLREYCQRRGGNLWGSIMVQPLTFLILT